MLQAYEIIYSEDGHIVGSEEIDIKTLVKVKIPDTDKIMFMQDNGDRILSQYQIIFQESIKKISNELKILIHYVPIAGLDRQNAIQLLQQYSDTVAEDSEGIKNYIVPVKEEGNIKISLLQKEDPVYGQDLLDKLNELQNFLSELK